MAGLLILSTLLWGLLPGCGADSNFEETPPGAGAPFRVTIWNRSQFELRAITIASEGGDSSSSGGELGGERELVSLEDRPLAQEESLLVDGFISGATVSVVRERAAGAGLIEISSAQGLYPDADGYTIIVFDDTFRLLAPWSEDNPYGQ